jgi:hypothetical protein
MRFERDVNADNPICSQSSAITPEIKSLIAVAMA